MKKNKVRSHQQKHHRLGFQVLRYVHLDFVVCTAWTSCELSGKVLPVLCSPRNVWGNITWLHCLTADASRGAFREARRRKWVSSSWCVGASAGSEGN